jgi:pyridoxine 5-phosphate synthase
MFNLNLNIDHFATLRNARGGTEPDPLTAALIAENAGVAGIVAHLRKDRRHINDNDVERLKNNLHTQLNLEMCTDDEIMDIACRLKPAVSTLVPERENEVTTEGGLNVIDNIEHIRECCHRLKDAGIKVSLFIEPDKIQIDAAIIAGANAVEFNTLAYSLATNETQVKKQINMINKAAVYAKGNRLQVSAGHSLNYQNMKQFCTVIPITEYNIGHSIVTRSLFVGLANAIKEMNILIINGKTYGKNYKYFHKLMTQYLQSVELDKMLSEEANDNEEI